MQKHALIRWLLVSIVILTGPITRASTETSGKIRAAYLSIPENHTVTSLLYKDLQGQMNGIDFTFMQVSGWSELGAFITSGSVDVVFIACPPVIDAILGETALMQRSKVTANNNSPEDVGSSVMAQLPSPDQSSQNDTKSKTVQQIMQSSKISPVMQRIIDNRVKIIQRYASDPLIINTVLKQNAEAAEMEKIKQIDKKWMAGEEDEFIKTVLNSNSSKYLRRKVRSNKLLYGEAFLCDRQGALVGAFPRTSDYWQGDEEKFTDCFNKGNSRVVIGPLEFDKSTNNYSVQVSVPVKDSDTTIGVLIVGLKNVGQSTVTKNF